jgi:ABC-type iron transport system FetAB ATPase subunit
MNGQTEIDLSVFVEQAEYIRHADFGRWTVDHPQENIIVKKMTSPGAKLITGPRGCGKTTILLKSLEAALSKKILAPYVNFKTSLKMEPLYKQKVNAQFWFLQWMLLKVYDGILDFLDRLPDAQVKKLSIAREQIQKNLRLIERGEVSLINESSLKTIDDLQSEIETLLRVNSLSRCVILLDDAAHAFSPAQQEDFFDFFRKIKSRSISPKAAIYPGVTSFSASFHIGHDAEEISVWIDPEDDNYINFMESLLRKRFSAGVFERLSSNKSLLNLLMYAANGMPRYLLNMIGAIAIGDDESGDERKVEEIKIDKGIALKAIEKCHLNTLAIYRSLSTKLPIYAGFVAQGERFYEIAISLVKSYNKERDIDKQSRIIGIKQPIEPEVIKVLEFLEYAGLISPSGDTKRGEKGVYDLYAIHNAVIINRNVFFSSRGINPANYITAFEHKSGRNYPRVTTQTIFSTNNVSALFELSLPPCSECSTPRVNEGAMYCIRCGAELTQISIFEQIVNQSIDILPLTESRIQSIKDSCSIRTIKDILMDQDRRQLRKVHMIGEVWASRIANYAEEQIA